MEGDVKGGRSSLRSPEDTYWVFECQGLMGHSVLSGVRSQIYLVDSLKRMFTTSESAIYSDSDDTTAANFLRTRKPADGSHSEHYYPNRDEATRVGTGTVVRIERC